MKAARFEYRRMVSLSETLEALRQLGADATLLAGGQSLMPLMNARLLRPRVLLDLNLLHELAGVRLYGQRCSIGAMTRYSAFETPGPLAQVVPILGRAVSYVGHPAVRHVGTVGGSVAFADAGAELPAALLCLGADVRLLSSLGERRVSMSDFLLAQGGTIRRPDEILLGVELGLPVEGERQVFHEFNMRHNGPAVVGVALRAVLDEASRWREVFLVVAGLQARAVALPRVARLLLDEPGLPSVEALREAVCSEVEVLPTPFHSASFKLQIAATLIQRAAKEIAA